MSINNINKTIPRCISCIYYKLFPYMNNKDTNIAEYLTICTKYTNYSNITFTHDCRNDEKRCGKEGNFFIKK